MSSRREPPRRVTPDRIKFHKLDAKRLRLESRRDAWRLLRGFAARLIEYLSVAHRKI
ncbi:MAG: hypothetical protein ACRCV5_09575 [Afipia sp.]